MNRSLVVFLTLFVITVSFSFSQDQQPFNRPKLVVGVVVDQMRYDYLVRYWDRYGEGGFKRLVNQGFLARNHHFNYVPTATAPGHASVYTGATPSTHGILGNEWYDKAQKAMVYCVSDKRYQPVGTTADEGRMSPHRLEASTITDELRISTNGRGKTLAVSLKDRGAVLPAGHSGTAYWFYGQKEGVWISSTYYMKELPGWVKDFNAGKRADVYKKVWSTLYPVSSYTQSSADDEPWEGKFKGEKAPVFPHDLPALWDQNGGYDMIKASPFGNSLITDFALEGLKAEGLGKDADTDFLSVSYSSTDYVGHQYGLRAIETEDTYLRLDLELKRLLEALDKEVGAGEYTLFLTADHGAVDAPGYQEEFHIPSGFLTTEAFNKELKAFLKARYGDEDILEKNNNAQLFLNRQVLERLKLNADEVAEGLVSFLLSQPQVERVYTAKQLRENWYGDGLGTLVQNGFNPAKSGDVFMVFSKGHISSHYRDAGGTSHGTAHPYDTHVPLIFYGAGIKPGGTAEKTVIPDIAVTLAGILGTGIPNGASGRMIPGAMLSAQGAK